MVNNSLVKSLTAKTRSLCTCSKRFTPIASSAARLSTSAGLCMGDKDKMSVTDLKPSPIGSLTRLNIWTEFIALAKDHNAVNLGQGFPDTPIPARLGEHLADIGRHPERVDFHQYTRGYGHPRLVNALADFYAPLLGRPAIDAQQEVLVSIGAYLSLYYSFMGWLNAGDEVIIFEPAFDSYVEQIAMAGAKPVPVVLEYRPNDINGVCTSASFTLDVEVLRSKVTDKTKMIVVNNPNNPTGKLFTRCELEAIAAVAREHNLLVVADEVYEYHIYPPNEMIRFASLPDMYERTITICSAGKAFSATGWKLGWAIGPANLLKPLKMVHENCIFAVPTVTQEAVAREFEHESALRAAGRSADSYLAGGMAAELLPKRQRLADALRCAGFRPIVPDGGYFIMADFSHLDGPYKAEPGGEETALDYKFVRWLCREKKLATIPPSAFYSPQNRRGNDHYVRICFFKKDETLDAGIDILERLGRESH